MPLLESKDSFSHLLHPTLFPLPQIADLTAVLPNQTIKKLYKEAEQIYSGKQRIFDLLPAPYAAFSGTDHHWSFYAKHGLDSITQNILHRDIKFLWEEGRLGWIFPLVRAYSLSQDERYCDAFWLYALTFLDRNPPYQGIHWLSAQEVALRLMALVFGYTVFANASHTTVEFRKELAWQIAAHAKRIPLTLAYARAQNNNHLLSEAIGLYTAALALPTHPQAAQWKKVGWCTAQRAFQQQISTEGCYTQHSTNYHRLMLQLGLWFTLLWHNQDKHTPFPTTTGERLAAATHWLIALVDSESGAAPNLGHNDGAYIFPLSSCSYRDYRPVVQAAAQTFLANPVFEAGLWDEMSLWLSSPIGDLSESAPIVTDRPQCSQPIIFSSKEQRAQSPPLIEKRMSLIEGFSSVRSDLGEGLPVEPHILRMPEHHSWAYLRAARFTSRPAHADQLHVDLWWRGLNIVQDAGTYLYNANDPWDNALTSSFVHNTITIDDKEQMIRASRFLYLNWAQANIISHNKGDGYESLSAQHDGYHKAGILHQRTLTAYREGWWEVKDELLPSNKNTSILTPFTMRLHWLLLDGNWQIGESQDAYWITVDYPQGQVKLLCSYTTPSQPKFIQLQLVRAGELLYGSGEISPTWGWVSPHYGNKKPALSVSLKVQGELNMVLNSFFTFSKLL